MSQQLDCTKAYNIRYYLSGSYQHMGISPIKLSTSLEKLNTSTDISQD